ncbi:phage tail tip lysozyme [Enterococcus faecalis]|uniref:phage tail tip lysozyme n=1 Tax=Enterococcus faecalis TaxID=1351 RepID=UPI00032F0EF8|nr:phage tail tip lysozyme [Enterococcus faecalis]EGO2607775.1 CHAP domain-containing protein [Enterococcus faecalis]EGO2751376.1 CHAP domain-containing protein [Enterococcus faecalis]EGO6096218.1 CHAP domain-containing protein [Enterococcus faecalis]EGO6563332.1 CHAP domain-containing protein [Enterococcus faecalis]EGO6789246.1 CHAP domain-containing protein [Enterococcus faecalis]
MKKIFLGILGVFSFLFLLPFLLFLGAMSTEVGNNTQFQATTPQEKVALEVSNFVTKNGGTLQFASAWLGNMEHESGLNPARIQSDLTFNSAWAFNPSTNGYALGLAMMDGGRRVNLLNFAKEQKKDWQAVSVQLEYMWNHDSSDSELLKRMSKSSDVNQLAVDILVHWERAGTKNDPNEQIKRKTSANNWYKRLSTGSMGAGSANIGGGKIDVLEQVLGQTVNGGQCYGGTSYYVEKMGFQSLMNTGHMFASEIGNDYAWEQSGWQVIKNPNYSDVKAGDVINFAMGGYATSVYGHTAIVASVEGSGKLVLYEQNAEKGQIIAKYTRQWGSEYPNVTSIVRKK